jgi:hypothetical protein
VTGAIAVVLVYLTYKTQKEELSLTRQELKNSAEMMRQQKEIMDEEKKIMEEEKFHNYFSFLLKQKERYADDFYEKIGYIGSDLTPGSYSASMNFIISSYNDVLLKNKKQQAKLKNIQPKNLESLSKYMFAEDDYQFQYDTWLEQNNLESNSQYSNIQSKDGKKLGTKKQADLVMHFCSYIGNILQKIEQNEIQIMNMEFDALNTEYYDAIILSYQNLIETLENEVNEIMTKIDSRNSKKIQLFLSFIKTERDIEFFKNLELYQKIKKEFQYQTK